MSGIAVYSSPIGLRDMYTTVLRQFTFSPPEVPRVKWPAFSLVRNGALLLTKEGLLYLDLWSASKRSFHNSVHHEHPAQVMGFHISQSALFSPWRGMPGVLQQT